jgi:predicted nucleic acid-binding protein
MRIRLETDAYYLILNGIQRNNYELLVSPMHYKEIESIEDIREKIQLLEMLSAYGGQPDFELTNIKNRAEHLITMNFGVADAVHLAFAEQSADYFITCDDKLIKRSKKTKLTISVTNPVEFCINEELI